MRLKGLKISLNHFVYFALIFLTVLGLISGCASIQQPTGGPKDTIAPKILKETPKNLTRNFSSKEVNIQFSEFVKLNNEFKEISISPYMEKLPFFKARKNNLEIQFQDTLQKNTTYTINFGKAIVDNNEGNQLKNYSYVFATGNVIDSLSISGSVTNSLTKKPELDATVFIIPIKQDTIFGKRRASIFTTTDSSGNYSLKNLRADTYRIYALKEEGGDRIYNSPKEGIGFRKDSIILTRNVSSINLEIFQADPAVITIQDRKIDKDGRILLTFNKGVEKPGIQILQPAELDKRKFVEFNKKNDSAFLWLQEMKFDSLKIVAKSNTQNVDTVTLRRNNRDTYDRAISISDNLSNNTLKPKTDLILTFSSPVNKFDESKIKLLEDSIARKAQIIKDTTSFRKYIIKYPWRLNRSYILQLAESAFLNDFGGKSKYRTVSFTLDNPENYGNLTLNVKLSDTSKTYIVQLLRGEDEILKSDIIKQNTKINYTGYPTGTYYIRVVYDTNKNGKWDTGDVREKRFPEKVWYYEKEITLRANWDLEEQLIIPAPK
jgi:uncharacterized protein (DUF2141 family)